MLQSAKYCQNEVYHKCCLHSILLLASLFLDVSTHSPFCSYLLISNRREKANILRRKIKPVVLIFWSHENFKLKYLRIKCLIAFWPPVPNMGMTSNFSSRFELTFRISFYFLNKYLWGYNLLKIRKNEYKFLQTYFEITGNVFD